MGSSVKVWRVEWPGNDFREPRCEPRTKRPGDVISTGENGNTIKTHDNVPPYNSPDSRTEDFANIQAHAMESTFGRWSLL